MAKKRIILADMRTVLPSNSNTFVIVKHERVMKNTFLLVSFCLSFVFFHVQARGNEKFSHLPLEDGWDVIIVGGGPAGCAAAIASAREGAKTLLIEATGALGGMGTSGAMNNWCPFSDGEKIIYKGIAEKVYWKAKQGVPHFPKNDHQWLRNSIGCRSVVV